MTTEYLSAPDLLRKNMLAQINTHLSAAKKPQVEIARDLGLTQPRVSDLRRGKWSNFSLDALSTIAGALGMDLSLGARPGFTQSAGSKLSNFAQTLLDVNSESLAVGYRPTRMLDRVGGSGNWMISERVYRDGVPGRPRPMLYPGIFQDLGQALGHMHELEQREMERNEGLALVGDGQAESPHLRLAEPLLNWASRWEEDPDSVGPQEYLSEPYMAPDRREYSVVRARTWGACRSAEIEADVRYVPAVVSALLWDRKLDAYACRDTLFAAAFSDYSVTQMLSIEQASDSSLVARELPGVRADTSMRDAVAGRWSEERGNGLLWLVWQGSCWSIVEEASDSLGDEIYARLEAEGEGDVDLEMLDQEYMARSLAQLRYVSAGVLVPV